MRSAAYISGQRANHLAKSFADFAERGIFLPVLPVSPPEALPKVIGALQWVPEALPIGIGALPAGYGSASGTYWSASGGVWKRFRWPLERFRWGMEALPVPIGALQLLLEALPVDFGVFFTSKRSF